jgi:hypothetical protein
MIKCKIDAIGDFEFFLYNSKEQQYLIIDAKSKITLSTMHKVLYTFSLTMGFLQGQEYLGEVYHFECENNDFRNPVGVGYQRLRDSIKSFYTIYPPNRNELVDCLVKNGVQYALGDLDDKAFPIPSFGCETYGRILNTLYNEDDVARCVSLLVAASQSALEFQTSLLYIAFETICTACKKLINEENTRKCIADSKTWETIKTRLIGCLDELDDSMFYAEGKTCLRHKLENLNQPTNASKLSAPFLQLGYVLTDTDRKVINDRNKFLHGAIGKYNDMGTMRNQLLYMNFVLHKLCCILILRLCKYEGYIINNAVLYACEQAVANKEPILIRVPNTK